MPEVLDPVSRYILDGTDADLRRLLRISSVLDQTTRAALAAAPIEPGWSALECGCGPLGAMAILSELVGPGGRVVGVDFHPDAVQRARQVTTQLGITNVEISCGDINDVGYDAGGPYDLAFTRCFLMHQPEPLHTLRRIRDQLRPGGWLVCMEPLWKPTPFAHPPAEALATAWDMLRRAAVRSGAAPSAVADLPELAPRAGFTVTSTSGCLQPLDTRTGFELHAATTRAARERILASGAALAEEVDAVLTDLERPRDAGGWVSSPVSLCLALQRDDGGAPG
jgi:SAM-dependent methyltransferase